MKLEGKEFCKFKIIKNLWGKLFQPIAVLVFFSVVLISEPVRILCIYSLPLEPPSPIPSHPSRLSQSTRLEFPDYIAAP